jgi:nucleotidyltransferase/DNA polymerase involved in DNA repair
MNTSNTVDHKLLWAFAVDATKPLKTTTQRNKRAAKPKYKLHRYLVTSCSPRLRQFGVKVGMPYDEAKALVPEMRIFVYNR